MIKQWIIGTLFLPLFMDMQPVDGAKILFVTTFSSKSHKNFFSPIGEALAERGHQITVLTPYESKNLHKNIKEIIFPENSIDSLGFKPFNDSVTDSWMRSMKLMITNCVASLKKPQSQALYDEQFDLIFFSVIGSDCFQALSHHFKVPTVQLYPNILSSSTAYRMGLPFFPSVVPNMWFSGQDFPMTFTQRIIGTLLDFLMIMTGDLYLTPSMDKLGREEGVIPEDAPSLVSMNYNSSLTIINSIETLQRPVHPTIPTIIHAGGIHCRPANPLPKDLDDWMNGAEEGVILFSLGSIIQPHEMPDQHKEIFINVLGSLKQRVIWKWKEPIQNLPSNIKTMEWLPQQDIIGHEKVKLFLGHGGLLSLQEAFYHGVPVIAMPLFADQHYNAKQITSIGVGGTIDWPDLTEERLTKLINTILHDNEMLETVKRRSRIMRDVQISPKENVVYWTEYLLRHNGAPHLQSPIREMAWYQLYNFDVWASLVVTLILIIYINLKIFLYVLGKIFKTKKKMKIN